MDKQARRAGRETRAANLRRLAVAVDRLSAEVERAPITPRRAGWINVQWAAREPEIQAEIWLARLRSVCGDRLAREEKAAWTRYRDLWRRLVERAEAERARGFPLKRLRDAFAEERGA